VHGFGNWDMQAEFYCKDDHEYNQVMNRIFPEKYHNIIKSQTELRILQEHKCVWYPVGKVAEPIQTNLNRWFDSQRRIPDKRTKSIIRAKLPN
jgi:hypothetical protein